MLLRWLIGILSALALGVFALIVIVGKGFAVYRSGAGSEDMARLAVVVGPSLLLAAMLVSVFVPGASTFLHEVAAGVVLACAACVWIIRTNPGEGMLSLCFFGLWLLYYALSVWGHR